MNEMREWRYCAVGNIMKIYVDANGSLRYGTKAFSGRTKVFLCGKYWGESSETISVIGRNRFGRTAVEDIPAESIENVRLKKVYRPAILRIMNDWEFSNDWWGNTKEDKEDAEIFIERFVSSSRGLGEVNPKRE